MALATYDGVTSPVQGYNNNSTTPYNLQLSNIITTSNDAFPYLNTSDYIVVVFSANAAAGTITAITLNTVGSSFTRITNTTQGTVKQEIWIGQVTSNVSSNVTVSITQSGSSFWSAEVSVVRNAISYAVGLIYQGSSATINGSYASTRQNQLVLIANTRQTVNVNNPNTSSFRATPIKPIIISFGSDDGTNTTTTECALFPIPGINNGGSFKTTYLSSFVWISSSVIFSGPTVQLDDYTFAIREAGPLLNNPNNALPLYDIDTVEGLDDSNIVSQTENLDGSDGSYVSAKFASGKTIVLGGTIYGSLPFNETLIDNIKLAAAPAFTGCPFIFKLPNTNPRYMTTYPIACKVAIDRNRSIGQVPFQIQLQTPDSRSYDSLNAVVTNTKVGTSFSATVILGGNHEMFPIIYFNILPEDGTVNTTTNIFKIYAPTWQAVKTPLDQVTSQIEIGGTNIATGTYALDLANRKLLWQNGTSNIWSDFSSMLIKRNWFSLLPGSSNRIYMIRPALGTVTDEGFWISYANAWR